MNRACVIFYTVLKLYEEAVSTALKVILGILYVKHVWMTQATIIISNGRNTHQNAMFTCQSKSDAKTGC